MNFFLDKAEFQQAVEENERNESCLSELKTPTTRCLVFSPDKTDASVYMSPSDNSLYLAQETSKLKSPTGSVIKNSMGI